MKPGKIDTPLATFTWGGYDKLEKQPVIDAKFHMNQRVTNIEPLETSIRKFDMPAFTKGKVIKVGTCGVYEVEFMIHGHLLDVTCLEEKLRKI
jgi:hypothetical protein